MRPVPSERSPAASPRPMLTDGRPSAAVTLPVELWDGFLSYLSDPADVQAFACAAPTLGAVAKPHFERAQKAYEKKFVHHAMAWIQILKNVSQRSWLAPALNLVDSHRCELKKIGPYVERLSLKHITADADFDFGFGRRRRGDVAIDFFAILGSIFQYCPRLKTLDLSENDLVPLPWYINTFVSCSHLTHLNLSGSWLSENGLLSVGGHFPLLESFVCIKGVNTESLSPESPSLFLKAHPVLKTLRLSLHLDDLFSPQEDTVPSQDALLLLAQTGHPTLENLGIHFSKQFDLEHRFDATHFPALHSCEIAYVSDDDQ